MYKAWQMSGLITEWDELLKMPLIRLDLEIGLITLFEPAATTPLTAAIFTSMLGSLLVLSTI